MSIGQFINRNSYVPRFSNKIFILLIILASCANRNNQVSQSKNDTTKVIELAVRTVLEGDFPDVAAVKRKDKLNDSIFFTTNLLPLSTLPQSVDSFRFKILPDTLICTIIKSDSASGELPNYLKLRSFEKSDTGYFVQLESLSCLPSGGGGSVSIHIVKTKDTFVSKKK